MADKYEQLEHFEDVKYRIREEGFHYCFKHYSNWDEIDDEEFHKLRTSYLKISKKLESYVDNKISELKDEIE